MISNLFRHKILLLIVILGSILRLVLLTFNPPALNWDEVSHGYNAYSILKTGKDEWGKWFPLANFRAYGDYPTTLNLYLTIPSIAVFGLNEFAIRLPHAILGIITIVAAYYLAVGLTKKRRIGLLTAFLVAVEPWTLFTSRFVLQSNVSIAFLTTGLALFFNRKRKKFFLPLSFLFLGLTLFAYHTTRIFIPLLLLSLAFVYRKEICLHLRGDRLKRSKSHGSPDGGSVPVGWMSTAILILFLVPLPFILASPEARARSNVLFLIDDGAINRIIELRQNSRLPSLVQRFVYNRYTYFTYAFTINYASYFSPDFLFLKGGTQYQFSVPNHGILYLLELPFFYLGLWFLFKKATKGEDNYRFLLFWIALAPIPAALTRESFAVLRATTMIPAAEIITALGFVGMLESRLLQSVRNDKGSCLSLVWIIFVLAVLISLGNYLGKYFTTYRTNYSWSWQYGYKQVVEYTKSNYAKYDKIIITKKYGEPHEYFLFFWPWNPEMYRADPNLIRFNQSNWFWVDGFDKFSFVNDWQIPKTNSIFSLESGGVVDCQNRSGCGGQVSNNKCLLITSPGNFPNGWNKLETINFLDGKPAFDILEN